MRPCARAPEQSDRCSSAARVLDLSRPCSPPAALAHDQQHGQSAERPHNSRRRGDHTLRLNATRCAKPDLRCGAPFPASRLCIASATDVARCRLGRELAAVRVQLAALKRRCDEAERTRDAALASVEELVAMSAAQPLSPTAQAGWQVGTRSVWQQADALDVTGGP
eukprot:1572527-Prymnesium_polylepis.2